jgi:alkylated DNA repair dioxygenase AlkB
MPRIDLDATSFIIHDKIPDDINYDFEELWNLHPVEYGQVRMMGRLINTPRWQQTYGHDYYYTGMLHHALPLPEAFRPFLDWANTLEYGQFNQVLINWYQDGTHYIGKHSDDESQLQPDSAIMSISLGAVRNFRIRAKSDNSILHNIDTLDRSYVIMGGRMQKDYTHEIVKTSKECGRRINITMRQFK